MSVCLSACLSICLSVCLWSVCLCVSLSPCLSVLCCNGRWLMALSLSCLTVMNYPLRRCVLTNTSLPLTLTHSLLPSDTHTLINTHLTAHLQLHPVQLNVKKMAAKLPGSVFKLPSTISSPVRLWGLQVTAWNCSYLTVWAVVQTCIHMFRVLFSSVPWRQRTALILW